MPPGVYPRRPALERLMEKVADVDGLLGCWTWTGAVTRHGYGVVSYEGHLRHAHRIAYLVLVGPIPAGLDIDHLCRNRRCINPAHLEPVTRRENVRRALPFRQDTRTAACRAGHPREPANVYDRPDGRGRNCRPCVAEARRRWSQRRRAA